LTTQFLRLLTIAGPGYRSDTVFNVVRMQPYTLADLLDPFQMVTTDVALYLPRTSDVRQLANQSGQDLTVTVVHYCMEGASKVTLSIPTLLLEDWSNDAPL